MDEIDNYLARIIKIIEKMIQGLMYQIGNYIVQKKKSVIIMIFVNNFFLDST